MAEFYHFTVFSSWQAMNGYDEEQRLLRLGSVMKTDFSVACGGEHLLRKAIFGVLEPEPENWWKMQFHLDVPALQTVLNDIRTNNLRNSLDILALLKITTDPLCDEVYVADWGVHLDPHYMGQGSTPPEIYRDIKGQYNRSLVPLHEPEKYQGYRLPEVVSFSPFPLSRVTLVDIFDRYEYINRHRAQQGLNQAPEGFYRDAGSFDHKYLEGQRRKFGLSL